MRVRGGMAGILAALASGWLDPLDARLPEERQLPRLSSKDLRAIRRREACRAKRLANRTPF